MIIHKKIKQKKIKYKKKRRKRKFKKKEDSSFEKTYCSKSHACFPWTFQNHIKGESDLSSTNCAITVSYMNLLSDEKITDCERATLILLNKLNEIDIKSFIRWLKIIQTIKEGGFNGRTNKLIDSCYSFW